MNNWHAHIVVTFNRRFTPTAAAKRMLLEEWDSQLEIMVRPTYASNNQWLRTEKAALAYMGKGGHWVLMEEGARGYFNPIRVAEQRAKHAST